MRPGCYNCEEAGVNDEADITMGDFWGIEKIMPSYAKRQKEGISMIKINNEKGKKLFDEISKKIEYHKSNLKDGYRFNHKYAVQLNENRFELMDKVDGSEINSLLEEYNQFKTGKRAKEEIRNKTI